MEKIEPRFDAPTPGMSLTHELGARPWQQPAQYTNMDEVIDYYVTRMASEDFEKSLVHVMSLDIPLTTLANTIQLAGVMEGKHSVDTGLLAMPVLIEMMQLIGDKNGVKYDSGLKNETLNMANSPLVERAISELKEEMGEEEEVIKTEDDIEMAEAPMTEEVVVEEEPKGLMARREA
jgi:hypothetical protein|tara:strand:+ start:2320 stop:2850 length:531 start_codon:yes stop_codon:yes gene_type:complete